MNAPLSHSHICTAPTYAPLPHIMRPGTACDRDIVTELVLCIVLAVCHSKYALLEWEVEPCWAPLNESNTRQGRCLVTMPMRTPIPGCHSHVVLLFWVVELCQAPINESQLPLLVVDHDVVRLDVAVHDALGVAKNQLFSKTYTRCSACQNAALL